MRSNKKDTFLTFTEIDIKAVKHNIRQLRKLASKNHFALPTRVRSTRSKPIVMDVLAVVKANAYGHGVCEISDALIDEKVGFFGVSDVSEGIELRSLGVKVPILLFESTLPELTEQIIKYDLMPTICTLSLAEKLDKQARDKKKVIDVHVKIDTGMGRLGVWHTSAFEFIYKLSQFKNLRLMGILTHFPAADTDKRFTQKQINYLYDLVIRLDKNGVIIPYVHAANSMGLAGYKTHVLNLARPGLMLYGLYPHSSLKKTVNLKPAMSVKSKVIFIKDIPAGESISYGRTFFTKRNMKVAVIPIGYNDGYMRCLSNKACVLISGKRCSIVGRVTMDQIIVDISNIFNVRLGAPVVIMGNQKKESITADDIAAWAGTINYEIVCNFGNRLSS